MQLSTVSQILMNNKKDAKYQKYLAGYNGCDGGNPNAPIWICGIEPGLSRQEFNSNDYLFRVADFDYFLDNCIEIPYRGEKFFQKYQNEYSKWTFDQIVAKILCLIETNPIKDYKRYLRELYSRNGKCFKINLYPLKKFRANDWLEEYRKNFFDNINAYWSWCQKKRFPFFKEQIKKYSSELTKILICTGLSFKDQFIGAFVPSSSNITFVENNASSFFILSDKDLNNYGIRKMYITPFFNYRLMSNSRIQYLANFIKQDLEK